MGFTDALQDQIKDSTCALIGVMESAARGLDRVVGGLGTGSFVNLWKQLNRSACDRKDPPTDPPPEGGQCDNVRYNVTVTWDRSTGFSCTFQQNSITRTVWGQITDLTIERVPPIVSTNQTWRIDLVCRGAGTSPGAPGTKVLVSQFTNGGNSCRDPKIVDVQITRVDGLTDCPGYLPPPPPAPGWNIINVNNFTWVDDSGDTVVEDLKLTFGFAYINADLDIEMPVKVDVGGINFNGHFNFEKGAFEFDFGDINFNFNRPDNPDVRQPDNDGRELPAPDPGTPDNPDDVEPDPDVIEDDEPEGEEIVRTSTIAAIRVVVTDTGDFVDELFQNKNPNIAIPNYGYVQFFIRTEVDAGGWTADIPVKNRNHYIECPSQFGALLVRGTPRPGVSWTIKAYRKITRDVVAFPEEV